MDNSPTNPTSNSTEDSVSSVYYPGTVPTAGSTGPDIRKSARLSPDTDEGKRPRWPLVLLLLILLSLATGYALKRHYDARLDEQAGDLAGLQQDANFRDVTIDQLRVNDLTSQTGDFVTIEVTELATIHDLEVIGTSSLGGDTSVTGDLSVTGDINYDGDLAVAGDGSFAGSVYATNFFGSFSGDGSGVSGVDADTLQGQPKSFYTNASNLSSGTVSDSRLSSNVALLNADQTFSGINTFTGDNSFSGDNTFSGDNSFTGTNTFQAVNLQGHLIGTTAAFSGNVSGADAINTDEFVTLGQLTTVSAGNFFLQGGNSFGETAVLGTNDTHDLAFETDGTERMRILANGNVGIGTTSPSELLVVGEDIGSITGNNAIVLGATGTNNAQFFIGNDLGNFGNLFWDGSNDDLHIRTASAGTLNTSQLVLDSSGNVGIGTTSPGSRLTIGMAGANGGIKLQNAAQTRIDFETTFAGSANFNILNEGNQNRFAIRETGGNNIFWVQGGAPANSLTVSSSGNIGIGTDSPERAFHLVGNGAILERSGGSPQLVIRRSEYTAADWEFHATETGNLVLRHGSTTMFRIDQDNSVLIARPLRMVNNDIRDVSNLGIGTSTPGYNLDVQGGTGIVGQFSGRVIGAQAVNNNEFITLGQLNTTADDTYFQQGGNSFGSTAILGTNDNFDLQFETGGTTKLTIQNSTGNVGIGTANPSSKLHVLGSDDSSQAVLLQGGVDTATAGVPGMTLQIRASAAQTADLLQFQNSAGTVLSRFNSRGGLDFSGVSENFNYLVIRGSGGNVNFRAAAGGGNAGVYVTGGNMIWQNNSHVFTAPILTYDSAQVGLKVQGRLGQTADLLQLQDSAGTTLVNISAAGSYAATGADPSAVTFRVRGASGQTNSIARFESPGGVSPFRIAANGNPEADVLFVKNLAGSTSRVGGLLTISSLSSITFNNSTNRLVQNDPIAHSLGIYGAASNGTGAARMLEIGNTVQVNPRLATTVGLVVKGLATQSADLLQAQDSTGAVLASISATGDLTVQDTTVQGTLTVAGNATFNGDVISFSNNVRGIDQAITETSTSLAVTFGTAYPDANYAVNCTPNYDTSCYVTGKSTTGFTLNFGTAAPASATVDWFVAH